jgi:hypothetical protein
MPLITKSNPLTNYISREEIARINREIDHSIEAGRNHNARMFILNTLAGGVSLGDLERIAKFMPYILSEAVRELNHEVEYQMVEVKK